MGHHPLLSCLLTDITYTCYGVCSVCSVVVVVLTATTKSIAEEVGSGEPKSTITTFCLKEKRKKKLL